MLTPPLAASPPDPGTEEEDRDVVVVWSLTAGFRDDLLWFVQGELVRGRQGRRGRLAEGNNSLRRDWLTEAGWPECCALCSHS